MPSRMHSDRVAPIPRREEAPAKKFRPDIQGLRMIAVVAVILDHLLGWPSGGFVGVDIFFVISGFLITSLLLREHEKTGTISFLGFYTRRVKRIIPAAVLVIGATVVTAWFLFAPGRLRSTLGDAIWAFVFAANWRFGITGTDYFNADSAVSPLQHFWSLAVEEQFYLVWPWVMLAIFALISYGRGTRRRARVVVLAAIIVLTAGSFAWALWETSTVPTWAYFSTFSRAWELGIGALLAVVAGVFSGIPPWLRTALAWAGLVGIAISVFLVSADHGGFPAPLAALPVLATALVITSGTGGDARFIWPITNRVSSYIGDISYSLYLWHFPFVIFLGPFFPENGWVYYVIALLLMCSVSMLSYHLVEDPIRRGKRGSEGDAAGPRRIGQQVGSVRYSGVKKNRIPLLAASSMLVIGLAAGGVQLTAQDELPAELQALGSAQQQGDDASLPSVDAERQTEIRAAVGS